MNVSLPPELESFVTRKVESGLYSSQSEVVREGLRLLINQERAVEARLDRLRADVATGLDQANRGELLDAKDVSAMLERRRADHGG